MTDKTKEELQEELDRVLAILDRSTILHDRDCGTLNSDGTLDTSNRNARQWFERWTVITPWENTSA